MNRTRETHAEISALKKRISELECEEKELQEELHKYRGVFDNAIEGIFQMNPDGRPFNVNPAAAAMMGYESPEDFKSSITNITDIYPFPEEREAALALLRKNGYIRNLEIRNRRKDGSIIWVSANARLVYDANDNVVYHEGTVQDITSRKQMEKDLLESRNLSRTLLDLPLNNVMFLMDAGGIVLDCNRTVSERFGVCSDDLIGKCIFDLMCDDAASLRKEKMREIIKTKKVVHFEDSRAGIWYENTAYPIFDQHGNVTKIAVFAYDITERIASEEKLKLSEARFRSYFELPLVGIGITSPQKGWLNANDRLCEILGYSREELTGLTWEQLTHPDDLARDIENFHRIIKGDMPTYSAEKRYRRKDGTYIWSILSAASVRKSSGETDYIIVVIQDINERKKMEEELSIHRDHLGKLVAERTEEMNQEIIRRAEKEEQYLALVESVVEWVWETDEHFVHTYVSPRIFEDLGHKPEVFLGKTPYDFMPADAIPVLKRFISRRKPFAYLQLPAVHKNGHIILIEASGKPYFDKYGTFKGYRGSCRDITEQKRTMDMLQENEKQLTAQSETLKETNAALRVLLKQREDDKREMEDMFMSNIKEMILPYVHKMQKEKMEMRHRAYLDIINTNLNEIMAPFLNRIRQLNFTPKEIEVASLIKDGKTTKEIAEIMGVATSAIDSHRNNIRTKLGLVNKDVNLRSYLMSFK
jgi:PAS domain S-box-containing protein